MPDDIFSQFPNWDNPAYRRYWLKHNLNADIWQDYTAADIYRGLASEGRPVSYEMVRDVRAYVLASDERIAAFDDLDPNNTIPIGLHEHEPYWTMSSNFLYVVEMVSTDDEGNEVFTTRAIGSNKQLSPDELFATADYLFGEKGNSEPIAFDSIYISHAYQR